MFLKPLPAQPEEEIRIKASPPLISFADCVIFITLLMLLRCRYATPNVRSQSISAIVSAG